MFIMYSTTVVNACRPCLV